MSYTKDWLDPMPQDGDERERMEEAERERLRDDEVLRREAAEQMRVSQLHEAARQARADALARSLFSQAASSLRTLYGKEVQP